jgi:flagellar basal body-associated protein FliL
VATGIGLHKYAREKSMMVMMMMVVVVVVVVVMMMIEFLPFTKYTTRTKTEL